MVRDLVLFLLIIPTWGSLDSNPCPLALSVDLTGGTRHRNGTITNDGLTYTPDLYFEHEGSPRGCPCQVRRCVRKCCPRNEAVINETCGPYEGDDFHFGVYNGTTEIAANGSTTTTTWGSDGGDDYFYFVYGRKCNWGFYLLSPAEYEEDTFHVQHDGKLYMEFGDPARDLLAPEEFCLDVFVWGEGDGNLSALVCLPETVEIVVSYGMIISMPFLLVTFLVYAVLPDRNLHGKALMCYVFSLFWAYVFLVFIQLYPEQLEMGACKAIGILCVFCFMVSFFWMNVMSIDIWWAFSGLRGFSGSKKEAERKRFILYGVYACGVPLLLIGVITYLSISPNIPHEAWYNPGIGAGQCWFQDGYPTLLYFYGPMAVLILANMVLFAVTAWKIKQVQQDTAVLRKDESKKHSYENDKQRFNLYLKLLLAMGVNWSMEIISWTLDWQIRSIPPAVWYLTDFCNALYGVFIFFIFVFKRNIWKLLKRRYYMMMGKPHLARTMTQTAYSPRTTGSCLSQTDKSFVNDSSILTSEVA